MKRGDIKLMIVGSTGSGKSTITSLVYDALKAKGLNVEIISEVDSQFIDDRIEAIKDQLITIEEYQANRKK